MTSTLIFIYTKKANLCLSMLNKTTNREQVQVLSKYLEFPL